MKYIKRALIFLTAVFLSIIIVSRKAVSNDNATIIIGTASGYAPFVSINAQGEYEGFDIDVAHALAQKLGKKLVIKDLGSMAPLFMALDQGSIDAIIWGLSITQDRLKKVAMIPYQGERTTTYPLLFWKQIPAGITHLSDMNNKTVCIEPASSQQAFLNKFPSIKQLPTEKVDDALFNLQYGKADAALVEPAIAKKFKKKYPALRVIEVPLQPQDYVEDVGIAIQKTNKHLIESLTHAIEALKVEGTITKLEEKWGLA